MNERDAFIALNMMSSVGPVTVRALMDLLGSAADIFSANEERLLAANGVGKAAARAILEQRDTVDWETECVRTEDAGARIVTPLDGEYPDPLKAIHDPPLALYVRGTLEHRDQHGVAVVGMRRPTHYGRRCAEQLASQLASAGFTVTSGLAAGIDTAAHEGCLKAHGRTVAVLGGALDHVYPKSNIGLADRISETGAVISEFPFGRAPDKTTFPMRNRIVSGISRGVLVVEAGAKSGALITARMAIEQGRAVFAMPGRVDSSSSRGPHALLKGGARLVETVEDILAEFEFLLPRIGKDAVAAPLPQPELSDDERTLVTLLEDGPEDTDSLIRRAGLPPSTVGALLIGLEMKRMIRMLPGHIVESR